MSKILVVDIGGTNVKIGFSLCGQPHEKTWLFPASEMRLNDPVEALAAMTRSVIDETDLVPDVIVSTVPGFVDTCADRILYAGNIPQLAGRNLATEWSKLTGIPVILERDAVQLLLGESIAGACQGEKSVLGFFFGTGVGAAFLENGRPFRGSGWALEVGHMPFRNNATRHDIGRPGNIDCLEAHVSGQVLQIIGDAHAVNIERLFLNDAADTNLARALDAFIEDLAAAVATSVVMFSPEVLLLGGGVCEMQGFPKDQAGALIESYSPIAQTCRPMDLRWATLGWQSVLHGAPEVVRSALGRRRNARRLPASLVGAEFGD